MSGPPAGDARMRTISPGRVLLAVICIALALGYLANAGWNVWNLLQQPHDDLGQMLAAATLPFPLARRVVPVWIEGASVAVFLLLALLALLSLGAFAGRRGRRSLSDANDNSAVVFIADKSRAPLHPRTAPPASTPPPPAP